VVAFGGDQLLVAWEDRRIDRQWGDVYAARLAPDGTMLDPTGLALGTGTGPQRAPAVAWDGRNFVVAWHDGKNGLAIARIGLTGALLDPLPLHVPGTADLQLLSEPALWGDRD